MYRMDHAYKRHRYWLPPGQELSKLPSEYFRENIYTTFQDDCVAFQTADLMNWRRLMWANDFPHSDSTWPWSQEMLAEARRRSDGRAAPRDPLRQRRGAVRDRPRRAGVTASAPRCGRAARAPGWLPSCSVLHRGSPAGSAGGSPAAQRESSHDIRHLDPRRISVHEVSASLERMRFNLTRTRRGRGPEAQGGARGTVEEGSSRAGVRPRGAGESGAAGAGRRAGTGRRPGRGGVRHLRALPRRTGRGNHDRGAGDRRAARLVHRAQIGKFKPGRRGCAPRRRRRSAHAADGRRCTARATSSRSPLRRSLPPAPPDDARRRRRGEGPDLVHRLHHLPRPRRQGNEAAEAPPSCARPTGT